MATYTSFVIDQNSDFLGQISLVDSNGLPLNVAGYVPYAQIRRNYTSTTATSFISSVSSASSGIVTIAMMASVSAALTAQRYVFDMVLVNSTSSTSISTLRVLEGEVEIAPSVTIPGT